MHQQQKKHGMCVVVFGGECPVYIYRSYQNRLVKLADDMCLSVLVIL